MPNIVEFADVREHEFHSVLRNTVGICKRNSGGSAFPNPVNRAALCLVRAEIVGFPAGNNQSALRIRRCDRAESRA